MHPPRQKHPTALVAEARSGCFQAVGLLFLHPCWVLSRKAPTGRRLLRGMRPETKWNGAPARRAFDRRRGDDGWART